MRRIPCLVFVLLALSGLGSQLSAQEAGPGGRMEKGFRLEQNYPNPFNPETKIPFLLGEELFGNGQPVRVTIRIYNVLQQFVASPTALNHSLGEGVPVENVEYQLPGRHEAYWDGRDRNGSQVASGVYLVQLVVNGQSTVMKMFVTK